MRALFKELPVFERVRSDYLDDEQYRHLQQTLLANPEAGDVIEGTGTGTPAAAKANGAACASFTTGGWVARSSGCSPCTTRTKPTT